jgi:hypothetical protein
MRIKNLTQVILQIAVISTLGFPNGAWARFGDVGLDATQNNYNPKPVVQSAPVVAVHSSWTSWSGFKEKIKTAIFGFGSTVENKPAAEVVVVAPPVLEQKEQENWKASAQKIRELKVSRTITSAKKFDDKNLVMGHNNIPVFEFKKYRAKLQIKKVYPLPLLNVGEEATLDPNGFQLVNIGPFPDGRIHKIQELPTPLLYSENQVKEFLKPDLLKAMDVEKLDIPVLEADKKVTAEKINQFFLIQLPSSQSHY